MILGVVSYQCLITSAYITKRQASVAQWLARSAVNRKVGGSSPPGGVYYFCLDWYQNYFYFNNNAPFVYLRILLNIKHCHLPSYIVYGNVKITYIYMELRTYRHFVFSAIIF